MGSSSCYFCCDDRRSSGNEVHNISVIPDHNNNRNRNIVEINGIACCTSFNNLGNKQFLKINGLACCNEIKNEEYPDINNYNNIPHNRRFNNISNITNDS